LIAGFGFDRSAEPAAGVWFKYWDEQSREERTEVAWWLPLHYSYSTGLMIFYYSLCCGRHVSKPAKHGCALLFISMVPPFYFLFCILSKALFGTREFET
jgi:hypothetical protein